MLRTLALLCLLSGLTVSVAAVEVVRSPARSETIEVERTAPARRASEAATPGDVQREQRPRMIAVAEPVSDCVLSSGPFALPVGTRSVDWKLVNRGDATARVEVAVYRLRIGASAEVLPPGTLRHDLAPAHETHNANSVGGSHPFQAGSDYEVVVRRSDARVLPAVSFWSDHGNTEIPGTRIGPEGFVAVGGDCLGRGTHD